MHNNVSLVRRPIENIRKDLEAFDMRIKGGGFPIARQRTARRRRYGAWSMAASFAALVATSLLASSVLLTSSAI